VPQIAGWLKGFQYSRKKGDRKVALVVEPFASCAIDVDEWDDLDEREILLIVEERRQPVPKRPMDEYLDKVQAEADEQDAAADGPTAAEIEVYVLARLEQVNKCDGCPYASTEADVDCDPEKCNQRLEELRTQYRDDYLAQQAQEETGAAATCQRESCDGCEFTYGDVGCTGVARTEPTVSAEPDEYDQDGLEALAEAHMDEVDTELQEKEFAEVH
jgi:hypothetical protein